MNSFAYRFENYELTSYIIAKKYRAKVEGEYQELVEELYEDSPIVKVAHDYDLGRMYFSGGSVENFVLEMIEQKEAAFNRLRRIRKKDELLTVALESLTPRELGVIEVHYFDRENDLGLSNQHYNEVLIEAQNNLCIFIEHEREKHREEIEMKRVEARRKIGEQIKQEKIRI